MYKDEFGVRLVQKHLIADEVFIFTTGSQTCTCISVLFGEKIPAKFRHLAIAINPVWTLCLPE